MLAAGARQDYTESVSTPPPVTPSTPAQLVAQLIAHDLGARRGVSQSLARGALLLEVHGGAAGAETWTVIWGPHAVQVQRGATVPPLVPWAALRATEGALLALVRGEAGAVELLASGRLETRGDGRVLQGVAATLRPGQSWLSVQLRR